MENPSTSSDFSTLSARDMEIISNKYKFVRDELKIARIKFALNSLKKYVLKNPKNNVFFSPHLIYQNLLMILLGIKGNTDSLKRVLYISDNIFIFELYYTYIWGEVNNFTYVTEKKNLSTCRIYSRFWISNCKLKEDTPIYYKLQRDFWSGHQLMPIDFNSNPDRKRIFINNCINSVTEHRICDLLPSDSIHSKTDLVLINAIYCKTQEMQDPSKYNKKNDGNSENLQNLLEQNDKSHAKSLIIFEEVTTCTNGISVYFIYVKDDSKIKESDKIIQCIEYLTTDEGFQQLNQRLECSWKQEANVSFPTFKFVQDLRMYELLEILGVPELTPLGTACVQRYFCEERDHLRLGDTVHRVNIETTPNYIVATASNAFFTVNSSQHEHIDTGGSYEPCICLIYDKVKKNILFCGALLKEKKEIAV